MENRLKLPGEKVMLRGMYEMTSGENQERMAVNVFGRDQPTQSRAFNFFVNHMYDTFHHLVHDNLDWWFRNEFAQRSAYAIGQKMGLPDPTLNLVCCFIDCNCMPTSVTGGGPAEAGANAARWDDRAQRSMYNGWKSLHGLKHQTLTDVFGLCPDMHRPRSLRRNDSNVLRRSEVNARFKEEQEGEVRQYIIMGDSAYKKQSHITSYHKLEEGIPRHQEWNRRIKKVRIAIEWDYGHTATLFEYVKRESKLKLLKSKIVSRIYTVATILRNIHVGFYGSQTSNYFGVELPDDFVECYLTQADVNW